jgi:hypothetical protein
LNFSGRTTVRGGAAKFGRRRCPERPMRYSYSWHWSTETANHACHRPGPAPICCIRPVSIGSGHDGDGDSRALVLINQSALHGRPFRKSGFRDADRTVRPSRSFRSQIRWGSNASTSSSIKSKVLQRFHVWRRIVGARWRSRLSSARCQ